MLGRHDFHEPQYILQNDITANPYPPQGYSYTNTYANKQDGNNVLRNRQDNLKKSKQSKKGSYLVNVDFREVVEMSYWLIKFVGQFEKEYKAHTMSKSGEAELKSETVNDKKTSGIFTKNAATMISYSRFLLKFLGSFEKLFKKL